MTTPLLDADRLAREAAVRSFDRHMILEAGAGTGKTTVLVDRALTWYLGAGYEAASAGDDADEALRSARVLDGLAALTFSEAAAAEMESRIVAALRDIARGRARPRLAAAKLDEPALAQRAASLLDQCERLQVTTIHSFCRKLLVADPLEAGVAPGFRINASGRCSKPHSSRHYSISNPSHKHHLVSQGLIIENVPDFLLMR